MSTATLAVLNEQEEMMEQISKVWIIEGSPCRCFCCHAVECYTRRGHGVVCHVCGEDGRRQGKDSLAKFVWHILWEASRGEP